MVQRSSQAELKRIVRQMNLLKNITQTSAFNKRKHNRQQAGWTRRFAPRLCCGR